MKRFLLCLGLLPFLSPALPAQVFLDFESGAITDTFRVVNAGTTVIRQDDASGNGYLKSGTGTASVVYDANGAAAGTSSFAVSLGSPLSISFKPSAQSNGSLGIYIIDAATPTNAFLAILNYGASDQLRFSSALNNPVNNDANSLVAGTHPNNTNFIDLEPALDTDTVPFASSANLTYGINALNQPTFSFTVNGTTSTYTLASATAFTNVEVGFRVNGGGAAMRIDNLNITSVPEPAPATLLGLLALALISLKARRRPHILG
jgi:MYXO-CTERM domain-containing protein